MWTDPGNIVHRHMNVEIGTEASQVPEKKYINGIFVAVPSSRPLYIHTTNLCNSQSRIAVCNMFSSHYQSVKKKRVALATNIFRNFFYIYFNLQKRNNECGTLSIYFVFLSYEGACDGQNIFVIISYCRVFQRLHRV